MSDKEIAINRSKENWRAVELLTCSGQQSDRLWNAAASRLYYAILQLVFAEMSSRTSFKLGASTESHRLAREYMVQHYRDLSYGFRRLERLRCQADYEAVPVNQADFEKEWGLWNAKGKYHEYLDNLNSNCGRIIP